ILMYLYTKKRMSIQALSTVIIILSIIDLVPYHEHFMPLVPKGRVCFETGSIEFLKDQYEEIGPFRVFRDRTTTLAPNSLMIYGLDEPGGFDSFVSSDYAHFFRSIDPSMSRNSRTLDLPSEPINYSQPFWNFLGIRYLLFPEKNNSLPPPWELRWTGDLFIYENTEWMPRWFTVPNIIPVDSIENGYNASQAIDPMKEAVVVGIEHTDIPPALLESSSDDYYVRQMEILVYSADELRLRTSSDRDQFLVFSDTYFPGWRAWIDRNEVEIYRTNGIVKGIVIPSGEHEIRFLYDPLSYKIGWLLVLIGLILTPFGIKPIRQLLTLPIKNPPSNLL
ncbi:YfhO family protein, partial [bacterium]|nr:YfhO family protein [bacterium]